MPRGIRREAAPRRLYVARQAFVTYIGDTPTTIPVGTIVDERDPVLKRRQSLFDEYVPKVRAYPGQRGVPPPIETATAVPGELRER